MVARTFTHSTSLHKELFPLSFSLLKKKKKKKLNNKKSERAARFLLLAKSFDRGQSIVKVLIDSKPNRFPIACGIQLNQKLEGKKKTQFECCFCCSSFKKNPSTFFFLLCGRWHELALPFFRRLCTRTTAGAAAKLGLRCDTGELIFFGYEDLI